MLGEAFVPTQLDVPQTRRDGLNNLPRSPLCCASPRPLAHAMSVRDQEACVKPPLSQSPEKFKQYLNRKIRAIAADEGRDRSEHHRDPVSVTRGSDPRTGMGSINATLHPNLWLKPNRKPDNGQRGTTSASRSPNRGRRLGGPRLRIRLGHRLLRRRSRRSLLEYRGRRRGGGELLPTSPGWRSDEQPTN